MSHLLWNLFGSSSSQQLWDSAKFSIIKNITITEVEIGRGSYGVIYNAIYGGKECVAKEVHHTLMVEGIGTNTVVQSFIKEVNVLSTLRHPSIVHFLGVHFREGSHVPILIMERMWKSLAALLSDRPAIPHIIKVNILKDVACGVNYLHSQNPSILHRDLTANNILLSRNLDAKIADLGLAKALETITTQRMSTVPGTLAYMPPEALQSKPVYTTKLDVFSFGCVILYTITQEFPSPTDQFEASSMDDAVFLKISEYKRRGKYMTMMDAYPHLTYLASACLKDDPEYRPDAAKVFKWIEEYYAKPEIKQHCSEALLDYSQLDKVSLVVSLDAQSTKSEELESTVKLYKCQLQELTNSTVAKEEEITSLQRDNNEQLMSIQHQQLEIDQLKSQNEKLQQDMSLQSDSEIVMSLSTMLRQEQEDMTEKQEEIKALKAKLNNTEKSYTSLRKENEGKEQQSLQEDSQLKAHLKREAELVQNVEVLSNQKECLVHEKKELNQQVQNYFSSLQSYQHEIKELKSKLEVANRNGEASQNTIIGRQFDDEQVVEQSTGSESTIHHKQREFQDKLQNMTAHMRKMQKENEDLKYKFKKGEEKLKEEAEQKVREKLDYWKAKAESADKDIMKKLEAEKQMLEQEKEKLKEEVEQRVKEKLDYWKVKAESAATADKELMKKLESEKQMLEQRKEKLKEEVLAANKLSNNHLSEFNKQIESNLVANEGYPHKVKQVHECLVTIEKLKKENSELKQKLSNARQQLEEKSLRLSLLQPQLNACQQKLDVKDQELNDLQSQNENLQNLLENTAKLHTAAQKELENYKATHKVDVKYSKELQQDINALLQVDLEKCQDLIREKENEIALLNENFRKYHDTNLQLQRKVKELEKQNKRLTTTHSKSSRQLETKLKEKSKHIEALEKKTFTGHYGCYRYSLHWSPYLSLPVRRIKPSAAVVKDKVFVTGGYQEVSPQERELGSYLKLLECSNEVFCFHTGKCRCDSIASPVVLGGVASVNGQCVLVSGAEGNTLTRNVYVLCEEGSDEKWKKFSEPVPTPRILPCVCCYGERWLIVCGGYACKEGSNLLEAVNVVEILDTKTGKWHTLSEAGSPKLSTILACSVVADDVYITGGDKVLRSSCKKLLSTMSAKLDETVWDEIQVVPHEVDKDLHPFSVVDVNGEPMIIASISGSEDDVTCVLMKDTTDTWRKMSEAVECQHCSAVVVTPTLELLLFGGSGNVQLAGGTDICQNSTLIPTLNVWDNKDGKTASKSSVSHIQENIPEIPIVTIQTPVSFTGPIHTKQFDHKGGTFQSSVDKVSIVVPPNAIDDGERVTVHMGATTSGPFDLPEDCKLRSAVVWLGSGSGVVLKRSIAVVVPHSAVFTSPQHHSMMRFLTCEDCEGLRYKLQPGQNKFEIAPGYGLIRLQKPAIVAIVSQSKSIMTNKPAEENAEYKSVDVPVCCIAKLFWPLKSLPVSFRADVVCVQNIPTELFKVDTYRKDYYKENETYPAAVGTKLIVYENKLKCILPCDGSNQCNCFTGWDVTRLVDITEEEENVGHIKIDSEIFSFKFSCSHPGAFLSCCFELQGASREVTQIKLENLPKCLMSRYAKLGTSPPILLQSGVNTTTKDTGSGDGDIGSHDHKKLKDKP